MTLVPVETDQKAGVKTGGNQFLGPVHSQCPRLNGPDEEEVRPCLPGARHVPEKNGKTAACREPFAQTWRSSHSRQPGDGREMPAF